MLASRDAEQLAAGAALFNHPWRFIRGVPSLDLLPIADRPELAFAGRSNVGKSSLFNALVNQRGLARASQAPGRTQELNFFERPGVTLFLVDMPGYGFAKAPKVRAAAWMQLVREYLRGRPTLLRVILLIDARHGLKESDCDMMALLDAAGVSYQVVLSKADKLTPRRLEAAIAACDSALRHHAAACQGILATSAETGLGIPELRAEIAALADVHGARDR
jgi:GTP-binding protein